VCQCETQGFTATLLNAYAKVLSLLSLSLSLSQSVYVSVSISSHSTNCVFLSSETSAQIIPSFFSFPFDWSWIIFVFHPCSLLLLLFVLNNNNAPPTHLADFLDSSSPLSHSLSLYLKLYFTLSLSLSLSLSIYPPSTYLSHTLSHSASLSFARWKCCWCCDKISVLVYCWRVRSKSNGWNPQNEAKVVRSNKSPMSRPQEGQIRKVLKVWIFETFDNNWIRYSVDDFL